MQKDHELLPAKTGGHIAIPYGTPDHGRNLFQDKVTRQVAVFVIQNLEIVQVDHQDAEHPSVAFCSADLLFYLRLNKGSIE